MQFNFIYHARGRITECGVTSTVADMRPYDVDGAEREFVPRPASQSDDWYSPDGLAPKEDPGVTVSGGLISGVRPPATLHCPALGTYALTDSEVEVAASKAGSYCAWVWHDDPRWRDVKITLEIQ
jgi:hypothetical protein